MVLTASPFRYPGGKSKLYDFVTNIIKINSINGIYIEPFAGGAGIAIKLLLENKINNIWINDYDNAIFSVWYSILYNSEELIDRINKVPFDYKSGYICTPEKSIKYWENQRKIYTNNRNNKKSIDLAFATLFLNRTNTSGIIKAGPVGGKKQNHSTKIYARFNKSTLIKKIRDINKEKDRIKITNLDGIEMVSKIMKIIPPRNSLIFFDPPYYEQGRKLYFSSFNKEDHKNLSEKILSMNDYKWIVTYDNVQPIMEIYSNNKKKFEYEIEYSANNKKRGKAKELMFASNNLKIASYSKIILKKI